MKSLQEVLETVEKYNNGSIELNEDVVECQKILRESEVIGEEDNGNVYVFCTDLPTWVNLSKIFYF